MDSPPPQGLNENHEQSLSQRRSLFSTEYVICNPTTARREEHQNTKEQTFIQLTSEICILHNCLNTTWDEPGCGRWSIEKGVPRLSCPRRICVAEDGDWDPQWAAGDLLPTQTTELEVDTMRPPQSLLTITTRTGLIKCQCSGLMLSHR